MELSKLMWCVKRPFIPSELFRGGLIDGAWFDPSDLSTLYQDAAGTTPVTAVEQPVGLMLDKSRGLMLGPELISNGDFSNGSTGWTLSAEAAVTNSTLQVVSGANFLTYTNPILAVGKMYLVEFDASTTSGIDFRITSNFTDLYQRISTTTGHKKLYHIAGGPVFNIQASDLIFTGSIDNISVREIYGYHATQSITASRPTLSARYNLLTKTEDFSDAAWTKANLTNPTYPPVVTPDAAIGPDGITYADLVTPANIAGSSFIEVYQNSTMISGTKYHQYYCVKPNGWRYLQSAGNMSVFGLGNVNFDLVTGTVTANTPGTGGVSGDITPLANGWFLLHVSATAIANGTSHLSINFIDSATASRGQVATGNGVDGVYVTRGDFRAAAEQNSYQRVNTATDYDTDERYFKKYLQFDGVDDYLNLPYMGLYAGGAASIVCTRDAVSQATDTYIISERSTTDADPKYFPSRQLANGGNMDAYIANDAAAVVLDTVGSPFSAVANAVIRSIVDSGNNLKLFKNGVLAANDNYTRSGTLTLNNTTIGASVSTTTSNYASMNLYGLIITKSALTDAQRIACERHLSRKAGVTL